MSGDISIDIGSAFPYVIERILGLLGKDALSEIVKERLNRQIKIASREASSVQCIGMYRPIPIKEIYQTTRLVTSMGSEFGGSESVDFWRLLNEHTDAIIFAGPGRGKTTLLHWIYINLVQENDWIPILYTLRWPNAVDDLVYFVEEVASKKTKLLKKQRIVLLVDGYDEIIEEDQNKTPSRKRISKKLSDRERVSEALREFSSLELGNFYLSCRTFYDVINLKAPYYFIDQFSSNDALGYLRSFSKVYQASFNPDTLLDELDEHGFSDFYAHPLLLALICILKSGPMPHLPKNTIGLIRRAIDTLTFRWDESKGMGRDSVIDLDGEERIRCLMRIAFHMSDPLASESVVRQQAGNQLKLFQRGDVNIQLLLMEIAKWYGIFIPAAEGKWTFVHRTMHDYLAARYWVESGKFAPSNVITWNARAAYAACLLPDATESLVRALRTKGGVYALSECLYNNAPLDPLKVAKAIVEHFIEYEEFSIKKDEKFLMVETKQDFFHLVSNDLLVSLLAVGLAGRAVRKPAHDLVLGFALAEFQKRGKRLPSGSLNQVRELFPTNSFQFRLQRRAGWSTVSL